MAPRSVIDDDCGEGPRLYEAHGARSNEQRQAKLLRRRSENRYYMRDRFRGIRKPRLCTPDGAQLDIRGAIPGKFCLCRKKKCQQTQSQSQGQTPHCAGRKGMRHKRILPRPRCTLGALTGTRRTLLRALDLIRPNTWANTSGQYRKSQKGRVANPRGEDNEGRPHGSSLKSSKGQGLGFRRRSRS